MTDLIAAAAARMGSPEHLVERSAAARAEADGLTTEEVLTAWAGGATVSSSSSPEPVDPPPSRTETSTVEAQAPPSTPATPTEPEPSAIEVAAAASGDIAAPPPPESVNATEALDFEAVITGRTAGLSERVAAAMPRWLTSLFFAVPLVGLVYLITFSGGPTCGTGGQLSVDRLTGVVENCDGSEFSAAGAPGGVDVRSLVSEGIAIYNEPSSCGSCHGSGGEGGSGPALAGSLINTFAMCTDHIEWVSLGTTGFQDAGRATYGDNDTAVGSGGQMPSFQDTLSSDQIAMVVFYERVVFGGQDIEEAVIDCGFAEPEGEPGEDPIGDEADTVALPPSNR